MGKVILGVTISLDGFAEDRSGSVGSLYPDLETLHNTDVLNESIRDTGAVVMAWKEFAMAEDPDWFAGNYEYQSPIFVVTDRAPKKHPKETDQLKFTFVTNLEVPWEMAFAPDGRIFLTERAGKILIIRNGQVQSDPWIVLNVASAGEAGLLGLALDPEFSINHYVYVAYTYQDNSGQLKNQLVRLREDVSTCKGVVDKVVLDNAAGGNIHDGGRIKFGPDGKLYWTLGETGDALLAQDLTSLNGKILRLNLNGTIPEDNPFPNSPVFTYGNRNSQGLAWQPGTDRLFETEHGPSGGQYGVGQDEVNYLRPGKNYGWPLVHGEQSQPGMVSPIIQSGTLETWAPSGAIFVTGGLWDGSLLFAGLTGQTLYRLTLDKTDLTKVLTFEKFLTGKYGRLRDVAQGPDGALYILTNNTDGRGSPKPGDDRILKVTLK